jgi:hypothetical protein
LDFFNFGLTIFDTGNGAALGFFHALSGSREGEQVNSPQLDIHVVHFRVLEHKTKNRKRKKKDKFIYLVFWGFVLFPECK